MKQLFFALIVYATTSLCNAQNIDLSVPVSFHFDGQTVSSVLNEITKKHGVGFSYSRQIIPVHQRLYCHIEKKPFGEALETLLAQTNVIYGVIGDQIVLSIDANKRVIPPDMGMFTDDLDDSLASTDVPHIQRMQYEITVLRMREPSVQYTSVRIAPEEIARDLTYRVSVTERKQDMIRAQVTFVPPLQADTDPYSDMPVHLSFNVLAGVNQSVRGMEVGGLVNVLTGNLQGMQAAGLVNLVQQDFHGAQAAGLVNVVGHHSAGMQAAGLVNVAGDGPLLQAAGLANFAKGKIHGQASGLINVAQDIEGAQISGLINIARNVRGVQISLINVADSVGGVPIGLVSFVRKRGYHSLELAGEDAIDFNLNLRLGVRAFYNILHVGLDNEGENWSLGYGIGTSIYLARRNYLQFELMSRHVNEGEPWTRRLNELSQFKMTYDFALGRNIRLAIGPSINVATSRRYDEETGAYGTQIPRYVMFEHTSDNGFFSPFNAKYWVGLHAGIRFGSADWTPERHQTY